MLSIADRCSSIPKTEWIHVRSLEATEDAAEFLGAIEGYASTDEVGTDGMIIDPDAFRRWLPRFLNFPVLLRNHDRKSLPVGKVTKADIHPHGLWIRAVISKTAPAVWTLIQEKILKAFSISWAGGLLEERIGESPIWREVALVEISVVDVPVDAGAVFAEARKRGLDLERECNAILTGGAEMDQITLDVVKATATDAAKAIGPSLAEDVTRTVNANFAPVSRAVDDLTARVAEIQRALQSTGTKAEFDAMYEKIKGDLSAVVAQNERLRKEGGLPTSGGFETPPPETMRIMEQAIASEIRRPIPYVRALINKPKDITSNENHQKLVRDLQSAHDDVYILDEIMKKRSPGYQGPMSLRAWDRYSKLAAEFVRVFSTGASTLGVEWIPTGFSAELGERMEAAAVLGARFRHFNMPTGVFKWPVKGARGAGYFMPEQTAVGGTAPTEAAIHTANATFTSRKMMMMVYTSTEQIEDSVIPMLDFIKDDMATTIARAIDMAIVNGDITGTHQDTDIAAISYHPGKAWPGLRKLALAASATKSAANAAPTYALFNSAWALLGNFAQPGEEVMCVAAMKNYASLLSDTNFALVANMGDRAAIRTGALVNPFGIDCVVSDMSRLDTTTAGINGASGNTFGVMSFCNKRAFLIGDRRMITIKAQDLIDTDQLKIVVTWRGDFEQVIPNTTAALGVGAGSAASLLYYIAA